MGRTFSIVTTSKGRLEHLKLSLPKMLVQPCKEVIVVDYSCPQGTGDYIKTHFPSVRLVSVEGEEYFSNWRARNAGASAATSDVLVFCDADTIMADGAIAWLSNEFPENVFGFFTKDKTAKFNRSGLRLATNQLRGFHVIPTEAFRRIGGYDEVLQGYAAGGDTDLEERLGLMGIVRSPLDPNIIIDSVIEHDNIDRSKHHVDPIRTSYCAGLLYRSAKLALLRIRNRLELPLETRRNLYNAARTAARGLDSRREVVSMTVTVDLRPVLMPRQLGYEKGTQKLSFRVEVSLENELSAIPE